MPNFSGIAHDSKISDFEHEKNKKNNIEITTKRIDNNVFIIGIFKLRRTIFYNYKLKITNHCFFFG